MTVGIYIRVSTQEQALEGYSISAQREKLKAYCIAQDWTDFKFYVDEGISAKDTERPQLKALIDHIKQGMVKTVLVYKLDRLTRSVLDLYKLLETFDKYNCSFKSATEVYDTTNAMGRLFITLVAALAQWERENLAERVRMGQVEKARQGEYSAKAPFGFNKVNNRLVVNEEQKEIILDMIKKIKKGYSIRQLAFEMDDKGIKPIRGYKWHIRTILDILHNPALYGAVKWNEEITENAHKGIIDKDEFEELSKLLSNRQNFKKRETHSIFIYQMKLVCPVCKNRLTSERSRYFRKTDQTHVESNYYRCQSCALNKRSSVSVSEKNLEKALETYMNGFMLQADVQVNNNNNKNDELAELTKRLKGIESQREKYQKAWSRDLITDEEFADRMNETKKASLEIKEQISNLPKEKEPIQDVSKAIEISKNFSLNWSFMDSATKRQFINMFVESIEYVKTKNGVIVQNVWFY